MSDNFVLNRLKEVLWVLVACLAVVAISRFVTGLGATTNMTDAIPWGLWKIFNMVGGAALATSGFVIAAVIYIFQMEKYKPVARLSVVIGFLGYGSSLTALIFDIGLPHAGWHPFLMWNPHSFLFEVFWCVSVYWGITAFELVPLISERFPFPRFTHFMHEVALPVIVLGITLSTMHHSSLGSLFLAAPTRLHPLWYSMWMPYEFFISAMGGGLSVIILVSILYAKLYKKPVNISVLSGLAKAAGVLLTVYLGVKIVDFAVHDKMKFVFGPNLTWESRVFWIEIVLQTIIPISIFAIPMLRKSVPALTFATVSAALGITLHRMDVGILGFFDSAQAFYAPNLSELLLSFGVLAGASLLFLFIVERFYIMEEPESDHAGDGHSHAEVPHFTLEEAMSIAMSPNTLKIAMIFMVVVPITFFGLRSQATGFFKPIEQPISKAEAIDEDGEILMLNGNNRAEFVEFPHKQHQELMGEKESCAKCHHLNMTNELNSSCSSCHKDMDLDTDTKFLNMKEHPTAPGYKHAMHGKCLTCHRRYGDMMGCNDLADCIGNCQACHKL